jgi:nicotinamide-nucleotide amidase
MSDPDSSRMPAAEMLGALLRHGGRTLATAESITAGDIVSALVAVEGSGDWLRGGVVAYASAVKHAVLGVAAGPIVDRQAAIQMALGARDLMNADVAIATTGCGGPEECDGRPPGTVWIAVADGDDVEAREFHFEGDPASVCRTAVDAAISFALRRLGGEGPDPSPGSVESRAKLLPEEAAAGSDDPKRQAEVILEESTSRVLGGGEAAEGVERRTSAETVEPPDLA